MKKAIEDEEYVKWMVILGEYYGGQSTLLSFYHYLIFEEMSFYSLKWLCVGPSYDKKISILIRAIIDNRR